MWEYSKRIIYCYLLLVVYRYAFIVGCFTCIDEKMNVGHIRKDKTKNALVLAFILGLVVLGAIVSVKSSSWSVVPDIGNDVVRVYSTTLCTISVSTLPSSSVSTIVHQQGLLTEYLTTSVSYSTVVGGITTYVAVVTGVFDYGVPIPFSSFPEDANRVGTLIGKLEQRIHIADSYVGSRRFRKRKYYPKIPMGI